MALGACHVGIKYALFTYNFLFLLTGAGVFAIGVWMKQDVEFSNLILGPNDILDEDKEAYLLIAIGVAVVLISFFGCIGSLAEKRCLLVTFLVFMFIILSVLLTGGILIYVTTTSVKDNVTSQLKRAVKDQNSKSNGKLAKILMDFIQKKFNSCCKEPCNADFHVKQCINPVTEYYTKVLQTVSGVAIAIAIVSLTGVVFSAILFLAVREQDEIKQRAADEEQNKLDEEQFPPLIDVPQYLPGQMSVPSQYLPGQTEA